MIVRAPDTSPFTQYLNKTPIASSVKDTKEKKKKKASECAVRTVYVWIVYCVISCLFVQLL